MTREQSEKIREVERIVDYLCGKMDDVTRLQTIEPLAKRIGGCIVSGGYCEDVEAFNTKVQNYALSLLNELKDKYLKIYAEL